MEFYYVLSEDERTATCYYDDRCEERGGILPNCSSVGYKLFRCFNRLKRLSLMQHAKTIVQLIYMNGFVDVVS